MKIFNKFCSKFEKITTNIELLKKNKKYEKKMKLHTNLITKITKKLKKKLFRKAENQTEIRMFSFLKVLF